MSKSRNQRKINYLCRKSQDTVNQCTIRLQLTIVNYNRKQPFIFCYSFGHALIFALSTIDHDDLSFYCFTCSVFCGIQFNHFLNFIIMNSIRNHVQLIGHVGKDVEIKTFDNGSQVARLTLATNEYYKDSKGEKQQNTQWHNIVAWGKLAEIFSSSIAKGNEVAITGKLTSRSYDTADGQKRYVTEVVASEFMKLTKPAAPAPF